MAIVLGTNAGFVSVAPTENPGGTATTTDGYARAIKHASPIGAGKITEIGWWSDNISNDANFEVGLYSHDAGNDKPNERLFVNATNAKGTAVGWKTVVVDWEIIAETTYWIAIQLDAHTGTSKTDFTDVGVPSRDSFHAASTLGTTWSVGSNENAGYAISVYAVYGSGVTYSELSGTCAGTGSGSGDLELETYSALTGTCAAVGAGSGDLGSVYIYFSKYISYKRLVVAGNNQIWVEDI